MMPRRFGSATKVSSSLVELWVEAERLAKLRIRSNEAWRYRMADGDYRHRENDGDFQ